MNSESIALTLLLQCKSTAFFPKAYQLRDSFNVDLLKISSHHPSLRVAHFFHEQSLTLRVQPKSQSRWNVSIKRAMVLT